MGALFEAGGNSMISMIAVLFVFSPLLHGNEGKSEANERQSRLRANLDRFVRNLSVCQTTSLNLIMHKKLITFLRISLVSHCWLQH